MMKPVVALVGRPNVGKSTLFNRLTRTRDALVADFPGLTRDRHYGDGRVGAVPYVVIDTGGFEPQGAAGITREMAQQAELAIAECDVVIFVVDGREVVAGRGAIELEQARAQRALDPGPPDGRMLAIQVGIAPEEAVARVLLLDGAIGDRDVCLARDLASYVRNGHTHRLAGRLEI